MDFVLNILDSSVNYNSVIFIIIIYIILLWFMLSFWVGMDAKKRYRNNLIAILFFFLVLILSIPALVFYLIVRPEKEEDNILYLHSEENMMGGVNVPVVNFVGKEGFTISLQLKIGKTLDNVNNDMNINVDWNSSNSDLKVIKEKKDVNVSDVNTDKKSEEKRAKVLESKVKDKARNFAKRFRNTAQKIATNAKSYADENLAEDKSVNKDSEKEGKEG